MTENPWTVNYTLIYFLVGGETVERSGSETRRRSSSPTWFR